MLLRKLGLVWALRLPAAMPERAESQACDEAGAAAIGLHREPVVRASVGPGVWQLLRLCWRAGSMTDCRFAMEGPAATLPASTMRLLAGTRVGFEQKPEASRLMLRIDDQRISGLPALCVSLSLRNLRWRLVALCVVPLAVAFETGREALDTARCAARRGGPPLHLHAPNP